MISTGSRTSLGVRSKGVRMNLNDITIEIKKLPKDEIEYLESFCNKLSLYRELEEYFSMN